MNSSDFIEQKERLMDAATAEIIKLMQKHNVTEIDMTTDKKGRKEDDDDFDEQWYKFYRVPVECWAGGDDVTPGHISTVYLQHTNYGTDMMFLAETCYGHETADACIICTLDTYIDVLQNLESRLENIDE